MAVALLEHEAREALEKHNIPNVPGSFCATKEEAFKVAHEIGYPVVLKVVSKQIVHKSEAGGVKVNLADEEALSQAWEGIMASSKKYDSSAHIDGMLVAKMIRDAKEVIIGAIYDSQFGSCVMTGLGGVFVEVFKDVSFGIAPVTEKEAKNMLHKLKSYPILAGIRGEKPVNIDALVKILVSVSQYAYENKVVEMDLNPVFCVDDTVLVGDVRILLPEN